jgi:ubiquinone/menaquinone biosynthesis C-methylase UbiE
MTNQKDIFEASEGDCWFDRNKKAYDALPSKPDMVLDLLKQIELTPKSVLEIGCSNGIRLNLIKDAFGAHCCGVDPSAQAINDGQTRYPGLSLRTGTAENLPFEQNSFDTVIFGFCLYLCDRSDLFKIAYEADRCLQDNGTLVITDFSPPVPLKNKYVHCEGMFSYKMDYANMFLWNPAYTQIARVVYSHAGYALRDVPNERIATTVLKKNTAYAYLNEPYKAP